MAGRGLPPWPAPGSGGMLGSILVDGFAAAFWRIVRSRDGAAMTVLSREPLPAREEAAVEEEGLRFLQLVTAGADPGRITFQTAG
jgi:winged helix DNA-binding protein